MNQLNSIEVEGLGRQYDDQWHDNQETLELLRGLIDQYDTPNLYEGSFSLLYLAALRGDLKGVRFLLNAKCDVNGVFTDQDPVMLGAVYGGPNVVAELIEYGGNVNVQDLQGDSALVRAVGDGQSNVCDILLAAGADPTVTNIARQSALTARIRKEFKDDMEDVFTKHGYEPSFYVPK